MANEQTKAIGYFSFLLTTQVPITQEMAEAITDTPTTYTVQHGDEYFLVLKQKVTQDIEKASTPFNENFFGLGGNAGQGARDLMNTTVSVMKVRKQQSINVLMDEAEFHLYKDKTETENHKEGVAALEAICNVAGVEPPKAKPARPATRVNLAGLL